MEQSVYTPLPVSPEEIARNLVEAWIREAVSKNPKLQSPENAGKLIGEVYKAVLQAVRESLPVPTPEDIIRELGKLKPGQVQEVIKSAHSL